MGDGPHVGAARHGAHIDRARIVRALTRYGDELSPRTGSVLFVVGSAARMEAFHPGVVSGLEERDDLRNALHALPERERELLFRWYVLGWPVSRIATALGISRVHCYRLRDRALRTITDDGSPGAEAGAGRAPHGVSTPSTSISAGSQRAATSLGDAS